MSCVLVQLIKELHYVFFLSGILIAVKCRIIRFIVPVKGNLNIRKILRTFFFSSRGWINNRDDILLRKIYIYREKEKERENEFLLRSPLREIIYQNLRFRLFFFFWDTKRTDGSIQAWLKLLEHTYIYIYINIYIVCKYILLFKYINSLQCFIISSVDSSVRVTAFLVICNVPPFLFIRRKLRFFSLLR